MRKQGNAFLAAPRVEGERFHYFETGIKRLIIELELEDVAIFLVHLSLKFRHRHDQLRHLHELVKRASKPVIVAGDFNTFWGDHEIYLFMEASGLKSANRLGLPSYPSRNPRKELDFVLYSNGIEITQFDVPDIRFSDHRPLICDFNVRRRPDAYDRRTRLTPSVSRETPMQATTQSSTAQHWQLDQRQRWRRLAHARQGGCLGQQPVARVMEELGSKLESLERKPPKALIITSAKQGFIAGADIKEFVGLTAPEQAYRMIRQGQLVLDRLAACVAQRSQRSTASRSAGVSKWRSRVVIAS